MTLTQGAVPQWLYRVYDLRGRPGPWQPHKGAEPSSRRPCAIIEFRPALRLVEQP